MPRTAPVLRTLMSVAALVALAGCGSAEPVATGPDVGATTPVSTAVAPSESGTPTEPSETATATEEEPSIEVPEVLAFSAPTVDGGTFDGATLAGKDALLWFWAPWCPVCQLEAPVVSALAEEYDGRVEVVGIGGLSGDLAAMEDFVERGGVEGLTHVADTDGGIYTRFGVTSQYDVGLLDDSGEVRVVTGPLSEAELRAELETLAGG